MNKIVIFIMLLFVILLAMSKNRYLKIKSITDDRIDSLKMVIFNEKDTIQQLRIVFFKRENIYNAKDSCLLPNYKIVKK